MSHELRGTGRDQNNKLDLPVPNYSGDHGLLIKPHHSCSQTIDNHDTREIYNFSDPLEHSDNAQRQEGGFTRSSSISSIQRESSQSFASSYQASVYNGLPATALVPKQPYEITSKHLILDQATQLDIPLSNHEDHGKKGSPKKASLKQIEDYKKKATLLRQELETLKEQRSELRGDGTRSPSPDTKRFLKDNTKLQLEIQNKLHTIDNVLSMLNGIIVDTNSETNNLEDALGQRHKSRSQTVNKKFNYVYYDPEMHWCRVCNEFPPTAKDYLNHLHSPVHQKMAAEHTEAPWHCLSGANEGHQSYPSAPTKRIPIRGLQFFVPATAWYCKLCDQFIGDLHCASAHIKSIVHTKNYNNFVEHNPHWETDWMSDRQKAFEKATTEKKVTPIKDKTACSVQYTSHHHTITINKDFHSQRPRRSPSPEFDDKKKYKKRRKDRSSSRSSDGSRIINIRENNAKSKKLKSFEDGEIIEVENSPPPDRICEDDRKLLENLKSRMEKGREERQSDSRERERIKQMQRRIRESERRGRSERRSVSRDRRESRDRQDRRRDTRDRRGTSRDRRSDSRDRRTDARERRINTRERRTDSRERQTDSLERETERQQGRTDSKERRSDSREPRSESQERRDSSRDRQNDLEKKNDSQAVEVKEAAAQPPPAALPTPLPPSIPLPSPVPEVAPLPTPIPPPVVMPPPQSLLPPPGQTLPAVPVEFQEALELLFPTDPQKCTEMLNAMQPGLLGPPPGMMFPPYMPPPGVFGFDPAAMFPPPLLPMMPAPPRGNHRLNRNNRGRGRAPAPAPSSSRPQNKNKSGNKELDELVMLGIDASDVGAGM